MPNFNEMQWLNVYLLTFDAAVTLFLLIGVVSDVNRKSPFMKTFIVLLVSNIFMQLGEAGIWFFAGSADNTVILNISALTSLAFSYALIGSYAYCLTAFVREKSEVSALPAHIMAVLCAIFMVMSVISLFNGMFFSFDNEGRFVYGSMYWLVRLFDLLALTAEMILVSTCCKVLGLKGTLQLISFGLLPMMSILLQFCWEPTPEYMATTLSLILLYSLFHGETTRQLAQQKIQLAQKEHQLTESRISIMLSQIQPHFMYNMLTTIMYLCRTDPEEAERTVGQFAHYIRANMDSITLKQCIPFENEMNHVKTYLSLEKKRFGDKLTLKLDIQETGFMLPALTVQPLIENAVKHGMRKKKELTIELRTYSDEDNYYIKIYDNGKGFDKDIIKSDGKSHIGIDNVRSRLQMMCGGDLAVSSVPESGTTALIKIPKAAPKKP
ncbi:MAG: histidine kinase [Clostridiales bacterium]|nr:histidine kinase [Clostridiales bacterium]